jgi:hypothetical protein
VKLAIGLIRFQQLYPTPPLSASASDIAAFRRALALGLEKPVETLVGDFLAA